MSDMSGRPWEHVAEKFMAHKGHPFIEPRDVTKLEGIPCWYFVYDLPDESVLELEVSWHGEGLDGEWRTQVTTFQPAAS